MVGRDSDKLKRMFPNCDCCAYNEFVARAQGFDSVLHLAVLNNDISAPFEEFFRVNVDLGLAVLEAANRVGIRNFVNVSTIHALDPSKRSFYAQSKRNADDIMSKATGIEVRTLYLPAVAGDQSTGGLGIIKRAPKFLHRTLLKTYAAMTPVIDVGDAVKACWEAADRKSVV